MNNEDATKNPARTYYKFPRRTNKGRLLCLLLMNTANPPVALLKHKDKLDNE